MHTSKSQPKISHIKAQIDLKGLDSCISQLKESLKKKTQTKKHNFCVVRERFTYLLYAERGFINVANIKNWKDFFSVLQTFSDSFEIDCRQLSADRLKVDNITASGHFKQKVDLNKLNTYFNERQANSPFPKTIYQYRRNRFPAAFIKTRESGTVVLHGSGKYIIVGTKNTKQLNKIYTWIYALIRAL